MSIFSHDEITHPVLQGCAIYWCRVRSFAAVYNSVEEETHFVCEHCAQDINCMDFRNPVEITELFTAVGTYPTATQDTIDYVLAEWDVDNACWDTSKAL